MDGAECAECGALRYRGAERPDLADDYCAQSVAEDECQSADEGDLALGVLRVNVVQELEPELVMLMDS